jgi:hypothetical protein
MALLPLAGAVLIAAAPEDPTRAPALLPQTPLVIENWFVVLGAVLIAQMVFFAVHAWRNPKVGANRRILWVGAIVLAAFVATPLYWWQYSERAT